MIRMNKVLSILNNEPWYKEGLSFKCTGCGACCTGSPGYTWVSEAEIATLAAHLNLTVKEFGRKYLRYVEDRYSLLEDPLTYDCIFLKDNRCSVYQHRPTQCRTFPYWPSTLYTKEAWLEAAKFCEGINHKDAEIVPTETIEKELSSQLQYQRYEL